jgi:hypothetical protein
MKRHYIFKGIKIAFFVSGAILLISYITMRLWNHLVPELFHGPVIGYCQALGLLILSKILFGGFKGRGCGRHCGNGGWRGNWKNRFDEKISNLTPEEREKFRKHMSECCKD